MKLTDGSNPIFPRFDFRASNNCCYIRTCADSCRELSDLIQYLADYGDLNPDGRVVKSQSSNASAIPSSTVTEETVSEEMMDAMQESPPRRDSIPKSGFTSPVRPPTSSTTHSPRVNMAATLTRSIMPSMFANESDIDDDDFCIIDEEFGVGIPLKSGEPSLKFLSLEPIKIVENHFDQPLAAVDQLKSPDSYPVPTVRFSLREMSLVWCIYGGKDFDSSPDTPAKKLGPQNRLNSAPAKLGEVRNPSLKSDKLDQQHSKSPSWLRQGGPGRDHSVLMELHLNKVRFQHEQYPFDGKNIQAARQVLFIQDIDIRDRLAASDINKFLYQFVSTSMPRQSHASMLSIKALHERPDPAQPMQECSLKVSVQPLRLNVDQESLFFLNDFFADVSGLDRPDTKETAGGPGALPSGPGDTQPVPRTRRLESLSEEEPLAQSALIHFDDAPDSPVAPLEEGLLEPMTNSLLPGDPDPPIFFKSITFSPEVPIRLDYHGKYVDMQRVGAFGGLLVGLAQLKCSMLRLKRVHSRQGIRGFDKLILYLLNEWLDDIRKTQLANLLGGVGPMHCLVQLVQGVRDLFWLPVEQYRKDGRIVRGVQRGASAFTTSTLIATIELTNRIVQTVQFAAESAYDVISPGPSFRRKKKLASAAVVPRYSQPGDIREGVVTAYQGLCEGFTDTFREIVDAVSEEREQKGMSGAVGGICRQIPPAIVKPLILASQATSNVLGGLRNQLQPENRQDEMEKWRTEDDVRRIDNIHGNR
ncbi:Autophagy-related protein 2-like protein A [Hypsibius exemplaris]|uniref:Autophagy-related protein 2 n=1 Tax=Hypsibius exemplaris TaxID=2072580 RepID=A0A1W0W9Y8_HYPEX|nr:Autophagy-related protein 2-like protein A [Hypsibius exemplaris]